MNSVALFAHGYDPAFDQVDVGSGNVSTLTRAAAVEASWRPECPVDYQDLRYVTIPHWGIDGVERVGEMIVHKDHTDDVVGAFEKLFDARFPIEEMRVPVDGRAESGNNTYSFFCRRVAGSTVWSQHASGLAVDINPLWNPHVKSSGIVGDPRFADRDLGEPGMILDGELVVDAFEAFGWVWGGNWESSADYMHFSANGR